MKKIKTSLILNILIVIFVTIGTIFMFTGFKFMPADNLVLASTKIEMFKYYTVDSNMLIGIVSLILIIYESKLLKKKIKEIPKWVLVLKEIGTSGIGLTFLVTLVFLTPTYGFYSMYNNTNLFFHLIVPILSFISYIGFEKYNSKYKEAFFGTLPMIIYAVFYIAVILFHLDSGGLTIKYEFYGFLKGNINNIYISLPVIYLASYLISLLLIHLNKKIGKE